MASTIAAITTGVGGVVTTADATGNLSLLSGTTTVVAVTATGATVTGTLSATGNTTLTGLAVNTAAGVDGEWNTSGLTVYKDGVTPQHDGPLHVMSGTAGAVTAGNSYDELIVEGAGNAGISVLSPNAYQAAISLGSPGSVTGGELNWTYNSLALNLGTNVAAATINFYPDNYSQRGQWNTTGLTCFASGVTPQHDGVLHVMSGSAGSVTASSGGNIAVFEHSSSNGISVLGPDASTMGYVIGSVTDPVGAYWDWNYNSSVMHIGTDKAAGSLQLLSGASAVAITIDSSQISTFAKTITVNPSVGDSARATAIALTVSSRANFTTHVGQYNPSISTVAAILDVISTDAVGLVTVRGEQAGNKFADCVFFQSNGAVVLSSTTVGGTPSARTYTVSSGILRLAMTSGTYTVAVGGTLTYQ